jgi:trans-aconitate methyltransferase
MDDLVQRLRLELEDIKQDLAYTELAGSCQRAADFGCGSGLTTLCLFIELGAHQLQGIDKDKSLIQAAEKQL